MSNDAWLATPWTMATTIPRQSTPAEPLAFVVTDENGVIADLNDVFVAWTKFARERLVGRAHSVVRSPGMPAGLFKLLWDRLKTGQPATAYLQNLPADGNIYTALVTMSPTTSGYLAVQQKPCRPEAAEALQKLYSSVRAAEFEAADEGQPPEAVSQRGSELLVDLLRQLGFSSYDDFMWTALPQEIDEYYHRAPSPVQAVTEDGTAVAAIMSASQDLARELYPWSQQQAELLRTWGTLSRTLVSLTPMMEEAKRAAEDISTEIAQESEFNAMRLSITVWASMIAEIEKVITDLPNDLLALRQACAQTRFWIGLAQIHTQMVQQFAMDFADPVVMERSRGAVSQLCVTLDRDFDDLSWRMEKNARFAATVAERIQSLHDLLAMPANLIVNWKAMTAGSSDEFVTRLLPQVDRQLTLAGDTLDMLQTLADQCLAIAVVQPMDVAHQCVQRIQRGLAVVPEADVMRVEAAPSQLSEEFDQLFRQDAPTGGALWRDPAAESSLASSPLTSTAPGAYQTAPKAPVWPPQPAPAQPAPPALPVASAEPDAYPMGRGQASPSPFRVSPVGVNPEPDAYPIGPAAEPAPTSNQRAWRDPIFPDQAQPASPFSGSAATFQQSPRVDPHHPATPQPAPADDQTDAYSTLSMMPPPQVYATLNDDPGRFPSTPQRGA